jgi:hypothetical protein
MIVATIFLKLSDQKKDQLKATGDFELAGFLLLVINNTITKAPI